MRLYYSLLIIHFLLFITLSCGNNSQDSEIESVMDKRKKAYETKDLELYMSLISPEHSWKKKDKPVVSAGDIEKNFVNTSKMFDTVKISDAERSIYIKGKEAEVVQLITVEATINDSKSKFKILEKLRLKQFDDKWLIIKESDTDFFEGYVYGGIR